MMLSLLLFASQSFAAWDSVAVFHRPEKVIVLVNEEAPRGMPTSRLQNFIDIFKSTNSVQFFSEAQGIKLNCQRNLQASSCTFSFLPGTGVEIQERSVFAQLPLSDLSGLQPDLNEADGFDINFLNSNGDQLHLWIQNNVLSFSGQKRTRP